MDSYVSFARFYDALMEDARYAERCEYLLRLCEKHHHAPGKTLDLACGTGSLTRELVRRKVDAFGADGSVDMLSIAMQKSLEEGLHILFLHQQMEKLELIGTIDTCLCTLDSINHITDTDVLRRAFARVGQYTVPDGLFIFDVNSVYKHEKVLADNAFILENEDVFCAWQNTLCDDCIVEIDLDFFEEDADGSYQRYSESFAERAYSVEQLETLLQQAGFSLENVYGDCSFAPPAPDEQRLIIVARKNK